MCIALYLLFEYPSVRLHYFKTVIFESRDPLLLHWVDVAHWLGSIWKFHPLMPMHLCETENLGYYCITSSMISPSLSLKMPNSSFKLQNHFDVTNRNGNWHLSKLVFSCIKRTIKPTSTAVATFRVESIDEMCNWNILKVGTALKTFTFCKRKTWKCHRLINSVWFLNSS